MNTSMRIESSSCTRPGAKRSSQPITSDSIKQNSRSQLQNTGGLQLYTYYSWYAPRQPKPGGASPPPPSVKIKHLLCKLTLYAKALRGVSLYTLDNTASTTLNGDTPMWVYATHAHTLHDHPTHTHHPRCSPNTHLP